MQDQICWRHCSKLKTNSATTTSNEAGITLSNWLIPSFCHIKKFVTIIIIIMIWSTTLHAISSPPPFVKNCIQIHDLGYKLSQDAHHDHNIIEELMLGIYYFNPDTDGQILHALCWPHVTLHSPSQWELLAKLVTFVIFKRMQICTQCYHFAIMSRGIHMCDPHAAVFAPCLVGADLPRLCMFWRTARIGMTPSIPIEYT